MEMSLKAEEPAANSFVNPRKTGWLFKHGGSGMSSHWRKRWFVADSNYLFYYKSPNDKKPVGILCLQDYASCGKSKDCKKPFSFVLDRGDASHPSASSDQDGTGKSYLMYSETEKDMLEWIKAMNEEIKVPSRHCSEKKNEKTQKIDQMALEEVSKTAESGPKLVHLTADRPKVKNRRPPLKKYTTFHEDDSKEDILEDAPEELPLKESFGVTSSSPSRAPKLPLLPKGYKGSIKMIGHGEQVKVEVPKQSLASAPVENQGDTTADITTGNNMDLATSSHFKSNLLTPSLKVESAAENQNRFPLLATITDVTNIAGCGEKGYGGKTKPLPQPPPKILPTSVDVFTTNGNASQCFEINTIVVTEKLNENCTNQSQVAAESNVDEMHSSCESEDLQLKMGEQSSKHELIIKPKPKPRKKLLTEPQSTELIQSVAAKVQTGMTAKLENTVVIGVANEPTVEYTQMITPANQSDTIGVKPVAFPDVDIVQADLMSSAPDSAYSLNQLVPETSLSLVQTGIVLNMASAGTNSSEPIKPKHPESLCSPVPRLDLEMPGFDPVIDHSEGAASHPDYRTGIDVQMDETNDNNSNILLLSVSSENTPCVAEDKELLDTPANVETISDQVNDGDISIRSNTCTVFSVATDPASFDRDSLGYTMIRKEAKSSLADTSKNDVQLNSSMVPEETTIPKESLKMYETVLLETNSNFTLSTCMEAEAHHDTVPLALKQAKEILRIAESIRAEASEMHKEAQRELEIARRERHDAEILKRNAAEILRIAKEKLHVTTK